MSVARAPVFTTAQSVDSMYFQEVRTQDPDCSPMSPLRGRELACQRTASTDRQKQVADRTQHQRNTVGADQGGPPPPRRCVTVLERSKLSPLLLAGSTGLLLAPRQQLVDLLDHITGSLDFHRLQDVVRFAVVSVQDGRPSSPDKNLKVGGALVQRKSRLTPSDGLRVVLQSNARMSEALMAAPRSWRSKGCNAVTLWLRSAAPHLSKFCVKNDSVKSVLLDVHRRCSTAE